MICKGIIKDENTIELKVSMPFETGQQVSILILPYCEEQADSSKANSQPLRLSAEEVEALELVVGQGEAVVAKRVQGSSPLDVARVMRALPSVPPEDVGALERAMTEDRNSQDEGWNS